MYLISLFCFDCENKAIKPINTNTGIEPTESEHIIEDLLMLPHITTPQFSILLAKTNAPERFIRLEISSPLIN